MSTIVRYIMRKNIGFKKTVDVICSALVSLYLTVVMYFTFFESLKYVTVALLLFLIFFLMSGFLLKIFGEYDVQYKTKPCKGNYRVGVLLFVLIFAGQLLYWLSYYPGGFNLDAYGQWDQVHGYISLNNWHPVFTTAIYWVLTRVADSLAFCVFVQIFFFSVSVAFLLHELFKAGINVKISVVVAIFIGLSPSIGMNNVCLYKDVIFTIECIWIFFCLVRTYRTDGQWIKSWSHSIFLVLMMVSAVLTRHNGIFLVLPLMVCLLIVYRKYFLRWVTVIALTGICVAVIENPVYDAFRVEAHSNLVGEIVGIPMALLTNAYVNDAENIPSDVELFLEEIADRESWESCYNVGEWDSCKWEFGGTELLQDADLKKILFYVMETAFACPETTYQSIRENTRVVWQVVGSSCWNTWVYIENNDYGINENSVAFCREISDVLLAESNTLIGTMIVWNIGFWIVCMLITILYIVSKREWTKLVFIVPILAYVFLTMLLLCGPSHRYFYFVHVLGIPALVVCTWITKDEEINNRGETVPQS